MLRIGLTPARVLMWTLPVLVVMIVAMFLLPDWWYVVSIVFGVLWLAPTVVEVNGASLYETIRRSRATEKNYVPVSLREVDGTAVLLENSDTVSVWLEVMPRDEVDVTVVAGDGIVSRPFIDLAKLSPLMRQSDVVIDSVVVTTMAYDTYLPTYAAGNAVAQSMGKVSAPTGGRTWINVRARVEDNLAAAEARNSGEFDEGMIRAVLSAVARLRVVIEEGGHHVVLLSPDMVKQVSSMVQAGTSRVFDKVQRGFFGADDSSTKAYALYPRRQVTREQAVSWRDLPGTRTFVTTVLSPGTSNDEAANVLDRVVLVTRDDAAKARAAKSGLYVLTRQQRQAATWIIPSVSAQPVMQPEHAMRRRHPVIHYGGGMGMYVGATKTGGGVFVRIRPGSGKTLHLVGEDAMHQVMVMRLLMESHSVNVRVPADQASTWEALGEQLRTPLFAVNSTERADFVVTTPEGHADAKRDNPNQCVIVISRTTPNMALENSIHVKNTVAVVTTDTQQKTAIFSPTPSETGFLPMVEQPRSSRRGRHSR